MQPYYLPLMLEELERGHLKEFIAKKYVKYQVAIDDDSASPLQVNAEINACAELDDQEHMVIADRSGNISVWNTATHQCVITHTGQNDISVLAAFPNNINTQQGLHGRFVSGARNGVISIWDQEGGRLVARTAGHVRLLIVLSNGLIASVSDMPGANASLSHKDFIQLWDEQGQHIADLHPLYEKHISETHIFTMLALHHGEFVTGHADGTIRIWDTKIAPSLLNQVMVSTSQADDQRCVAKFKIHQGFVTTLSLLHDGRLMTGGQDGKIRLLNLESKQHVTLRPTGKISSLFALPCGWILSVSDETLQLWDLKINRCIYSQQNSNVSQIMVGLNNGTFVSADRVNQRIFRLWTFENAVLTYDDIEPFIEAMISKPNVIESLSLEDVTLNFKAYKQLYDLIIKNSLKKLLISEMGLRPEEVATLKTLCNQQGLHSNRLLFSRDIMRTNLSIAIPQLTTPYLDHEWHPEPLSRNTVNTIDIPQGLICPITRKIIFNPVISTNGETYENEAIESEQNSLQTFRNELGYHSIQYLLETNPHLWDQVYLSPGLCRAVEFACQSAEIDNLRSFLAKDPRLVTQEVFGKPKCTLLEFICRQPEPVFNQLYPVITELLTHQDWHRLLTIKPLAEWLALLSANKFSEHTTHSLSMNTSSSYVSFEKEINNLATKIFNGDGRQQTAHLNFGTWYHPDVCHYLMQLVTNQARCVRVIFHDAGGDNTQTFKNQLRELIMLGNRLNRPVIFISKEPGAENHFICGLIKGNKLLLINPFGIIDNLACYQTLQALKQENTISEVYLSRNRLQQAIHEEAPISCGPITLELVTHILSQFTLDQLELVLSQLFAIQNSTNHQASGLSYCSVNISNLLPANLLVLDNICNIREYKRKLVAVRMGHYQQLQYLPGERASEANRSVHDYLTSLQDNAPSQAVFDKLVTAEHTIVNVDELLVYKLLEQEVSNELIHVDSDEHDYQFESSESQQNQTINNHHPVLYFLEKIREHLGIEIKFMHLAVHAIEKHNTVLFRLSFAKLIENGFDKNADVDGQGNNFLHLAARSGCTEIARYLAIDQGLNIKLRNQARQKPKHIANSAGHIAVTDVICERKMAPMLQRLGLMNLPARQLEICQLREQNERLQNELAQLRSR